MFLSNSIKGVSAYYQEKLNKKYLSREIEIFFELSCEKLFKLSKSDIILNERKFSESELLQFRSIVKRLEKNEPIQYILGEAHFFSEVFIVDPAVLIPRPETEELVSLILKGNPNGRLLDIGTGSGVIPITLKRNCKNLEIVGIDISEEAIGIARRNAEKFDLQTSFYCRDVLNDNFDDFQSFDIIVSNPPYVLESDKVTMGENVLNFEPGLALFVKDNDPLIFYKRICFLSQNLLIEGGKIYFEIHESFGKEVKALMEEFDFKDVQIIKDLQGKERIATGLK
jgi:release factor glutamine methyltransferase